MHPKRNIPLLLGGLLVLASLACNLTIGIRGDDTATPSPLPPTNTSVPPTPTLPPPTDTASPVPPSGTPIPPTSTPKPTKTPTPIPPSLTPTTAPTSGGLVVSTLLHFPLVTLRAPLQLVPLNPKLDYTAAANYGEANLSAGFSPDPYSVGMTSGGSVDVSYLGGSCSGFATVAPDLRINFGGGGASLLRIYFVGSSGDATMVVNDPYGNFYCVDDSFGTVNPTIDFNNPAGGSYDVWLGSYASGSPMSGTLYLTENSGNHP